VVETAGVVVEAAGAVVEAAGAVAETAGVFVEPGVQQAVSVDLHPTRQSNKVPTVPAATTLGNGRDILFMWTSSQFFPGFQLFAWHQPSGRPCASATALCFNFPPMMLMPLASVGWR